MDSLLSVEEKAVLDKLAEAWNAYIKIEPLHPEEISDFRHKIHSAQRIVMARPAFKQLGLSRNP